MIRGGYKPAVHKKTKFLSAATKEWATFVIIIDILFIFFIGEVSKNKPGSLDEKFKDYFPDTYDNLDFIGLRLI